MSEEKIAELAAEERAAEAIREAVLAEREACAKLADSYKLAANDIGNLDGQGADAKAIAEEIRARPTP